MKIALAQLNSVDHVPSNLNVILKLIHEACGQVPAPRLIVFPENSLFFRISGTEPLAVIETSEAFVQLQNEAKKFKVNLHLTTALADADGKTYNGSVLIRETGVLEIIYRKVHLFDIALTGQKPIRESDVFAGGSSTSTFCIEDLKFGNSVCYDIRFAELYAAYAKQEVDVILVPAAFLVKTGQAHWDILLRARAIESQCYVLAPAQAGTHKSVMSANQRETFGHTTAVGPWGEVLDQKIDGTGLVYVEVNKQTIATVREQIPMKSHRRL